jgi:hypothetical protein
VARFEYGRFRFHQTKVCFLTFQCFCTTSYKLQQPKRGLITTHFQMNLQTRAILPPSLHLVPPPPPFCCRRRRRRRRLLLPEQGGGNRMRIELCTQGLLHSQAASLFPAAAASLFPASAASAAKEMTLVVLERDLQCCTL